MGLRHDQQMTLCQHAREFRSARFAIIFCLLLPFGTVLANSADEALLGRIREIERIFGNESAGADNSLDLRVQIDRIVANLGSPRTVPGGPEAVRSLNRLIFEQLQIRPSQNLKDPDNLLPSRVLARKQGYCVGIAALYLLIAEQLDLPFYVVSTPSHVFLRYDDGTTRINIETLQGGVSIPDDQYNREQRIPEESIRHGVFMHNLTTDEFLAQVHNNLGVIYSERKNYDAAAREYESALDLDPRLPAALYNWGNDLLREGEYWRAVRRFSKSLRLYPTDVWALNNRGLAYVKLGKREKARRDFEEALKIDPTFEQARRNLKDVPSSS